MSFKPTLRILLDQYALAAARTEHMASTMAELQAWEEQRLHMYAVAQVPGMVFRMRLVEDIATGERARDFDTTIVGRFTAFDGDDTHTFLKLATGDIVATYVDVV